MVAEGCIDCSQPAEGSLYCSDCLCDRLEISGRRVRRQRAKRLAGAEAERAVRDRQQVRATLEACEFEVERRGVVEGVSLFDLTAAEARALVASGRLAAGELARAGYAIGESRVVVVG